jgi:hypothetical protein
MPTYPSTNTPFRFSVFFTFNLINRPSHGFVGMNEETKKSRKDDFLNISFHPKSILTKKEKEKGKNKNEETSNYEGNFENKKKRNREVISDDDSDVEELKFTKKINFEDENRKFKETKLFEKKDSSSSSFSPSFPLPSVRLVEAQSYNSNDGSVLLGDLADIQSGQSLHIYFF